MTAETLILSNTDQEELVTFEEVLDVLETAYRQLGEKKAHTIPRRRIHTLKAEEGKERFHWFNVIPGTVPASDSAAVRIDSATVEITNKRGNARFEFPGAFSGLVYLYDLETNELVAILQDFYVNPIRVAGTSAVVTKHVAPRDSAVMGLFGSGTMATTQLEYTSRVRDLEEVRVYSTNPSRRERFADRMDDLVTSDVVPVDTPRDAVEGCDIVTTATNSNEPVFDGSWLEPGTHVNVVTPGNDRWFPRRETDDETVLKSDLIVINSKESSTLDDQPEHRLVQRGKLDWDQVYEIGDLLLNETVGRTNDSHQITYHSNNVGMGIQFAAVCRLIYERALEAGRGTSVDGDLFMQYDDDLRAIRDRGFRLKDW